MVRCYWCISILIIIPTIRCCSPTGPFSGWSAVVLSDRRYPSFWNFDSAISIDVIRMKSYMDSLFDPTCVPVRVTINKLNFFPISFVSVFRNCGGLRTSKPYISVVFFYPVLHRSPCFPMQIEKDNTIPFLDTSVSRDSNGLLTTTVYRKPTHTDQYLAYDSHHPQSVKRGIVKCLYDRAKHLTSKPSAISKEKKHLSSISGCCFALWLKRWW